MKTISIPNTEPLRLDKALTEVLDITRSQIQILIKDGRIYVDGEAANARLRVTSENVIEMDEKEVVKEKDFDNLAPLDIVYEDDDVIVVNKPSRLIVHEADDPYELTLVDALLRERPGIKGVGEDEKRPGIVHRLDRHASGILIVAKTQDAFIALKKEFKARTVKKKYVALVHGVMPKDHDTINLTIARSQAHARMAAKPPEQGGRDAITHYDVRNQYPYHALLDVVIETGRTHQIRVHLFALGHPIVGDHLYKSKVFKPMVLGRIFLFAKELALTLPSGEEKTFKIPMPAELKSVLNRIPTA
jgi:23S rRNA pseudouridine1911/1915/1917 synthase